MPIFEITAHERGGGIKAGPFALFHRMHARSVERGIKHHLAGLDLFQGEIAGDGGA